MQLSVVGEDNRLLHAGTELAIGLVSVPERSTVLRVAWWIKDAQTEPSRDEADGRNRRTER